MEATRGRRKAPPASLNMKHTAKFYPAWEVVQNRQSATTDFDDTDVEFSESDTESPRMSMGSFGNDSSSSLSTPDLPTPDHAPKRAFNFKLDDGVKGPSGPHLFRSSIGSAGSVPSTEIDLYFERSPLNSRFPQSASATPASRSQFGHSDTETLSSGSYIIETDSETPSYRSRYPPSASQTPSARSQFSQSQSEALSMGSESIRSYSHFPGSRSQFSHSESQTPSTRSQFAQPHSAALSMGSESIRSYSQTSSTRYQFDQPQSAPLSMGSESIRSYSQTPSTRSHFDQPQSAALSMGSESIRSYSQTSSTRSHFDQPQSAALSMGSDSIRSYSQTPGSRSQFSLSETQTPSTRSQFAQSETGTSTSSQYRFSPPTPGAYSTVYPDVSHVEESEIRSWQPSHVAHWMHIAGYNEYIIDQFLINDITGTVLLNLRIDDLKELGIKSFGKRHQLMASIDHLRNTMIKTPVDDEKPQVDRRSYAMSVSPTGEVLTKYDGTQITPAEAVSIVGIEQVLPKPHSCSKGENCPKFRRRQRQLERLAAEFPGANLLPGTSIFTGNPGNPQTAKNMLRPTSEAEPSVIASSDVFGPSQNTPRLSEEALNELTKMDPQESVRHFLSYQRVDPSSAFDSDSDPCPTPPLPEPVPTLSPPTKHTEHMAANLRSLPKLRIPTDSDDEEGLTTATMTTAQATITPSMASQIYGSPTATQEHGPFTSSRYMPQGGSYRQGTPFSEMDVPITAIPHDPIARDTSQSVPPDMQYGNLMDLKYHEPRSASARPRANSSLRPVNERRPLTPIDSPADLKKRSPRIGFNAGNSASSSIAADPEVTRCGWMKKRKPARFLRHDWQDAHFTLRGTNLAMHKDELAALRRSKALETIDVDDYAVACSSMATSSKLTAAFKKSILRNGNNLSNDDAAFAFSLIPATKENEKKMLFGNSNIKSHHFAVKTRDERIDWMRELMLSKALRKGKESGADMQVNGNFI